MKLTKSSKIGVLLLALGLGTLLAVAVWLETAREILSDVPMPMHATTVKQQFIVDHDAPIYTLEVRFDGAVSDTAAKCLLGAKDSELRPDLDCGSIAPVFRFMWDLRQDGQIVGSGSSARVGTVRTSNRATEAMIVGFPARTKHQYEITLNFDQDAQNAKTTPPRVRVKVDSFVREDRFIVGAILDWAALAACLAGVIALAIPFFRERLGRPSGEAESDNQQHLQ